MRAAVLVADGVSARNFLLGRFGPALARHGTWVAVHGLRDGFVESQVAPEGRPDAEYPLGTYDETALASLLRYTLLYGQMEWSDTESMRHNLRQPVTGSRRRRALHRTARLGGRAMAGPRRLAWVDRAHTAAVGRRPEVARHRAQLAAAAPDVLFCTHQRPPTVVPPVLAARALGIPTATFIFSWDNLSSKGRIAAPFDHYLVWSEHMAAELCHYYPEIPRDRVHVVGTPQFDPYDEEGRLWTRAELCARLGLDPARPVLCFSGGDAGNSPDDPGHVRVLLDLVRSGAIRGDAQVVVRPAPVDDGARYAGVRADFPELCWAPPLWDRPSGADWSEALPTDADVDLLANLTHHADVNVNLASTMTLDFGLHGRPVVNVAFDVTDPPPFGLPIWDHYYRFDHYRPVVELGAARFARSPTELAEHVNAYLADPTLDAEGREALARLEVGVPVGRSSATIAEVLATIATGG
ncbi:MAG: hypothetical protein JNK12_19305 [Acidimicrobiales bacterium]|nr:hypothetical protein [Acidimicrobiales bacterium]